MKVVLSKSALNPPTVYEPPVGAVSIDRPLEPTARSWEQVILNRSTFSTLFESSRGAEGASDVRLEAIASAIVNKTPFRFLAESRSEVEAA